jgi:hypothetical protein
VKTARPRFVPRTARARATATPRTTRPVALTPRRDRRRLWQEKQVTLRLRHNDRVQRGTPRQSISYPFPFPLSLSYNMDRERGIPRKGSFSVKETGSEPPYWSEVRRPAPRKGSTAALRILGLRTHYWSEVRRLAPRKGSTAASGYSGSAPTTDQGFVGWPSKGSQPPQTQSEG